MYIYIHTRAYIDERKEERRGQTSSWDGTVRKEYDGSWDEDRERRARREEAGKVRGRGRREGETTEV